MAAYYNEFDAGAAAWLRELIKVGLIAPGNVDERSIKDVKPDDLEGYTQCHFFAGIGGWSLALRLAGWPDDFPVWTGSCPCQPYSAAGKGLGDEDPRNLWPDFFRLIRERGPHRVFGEQVPAAIGKGWLDGISADLEAEDYAVGAIVLGAHSVGAPHIRQRLYWVAESNRFGPHRRQDSTGAREPQQYHKAEAGVIDRRLADTNGGHARDREKQHCGELGLLAEGSRVDGVEHAESNGRKQWGAESIGRCVASGCGACDGMGDTDIAGSQGRGERRGSPGELPARSAGAWSNFDLIPCRDGKARRVESGTFPLAHGVPGRVGLLRGYGNAIVPQVAAEFIKAFLDV